jgi:CrcB protein
MAVGLADNRDLGRQQSLPDWVGGCMRTEHRLELGDAGMPALHRALQALRRRADILAVISAGGAVGSAGRYAVAEALPHHAGQVPWSTVAVNLAGSYLLGVLMVLVLDLWPPTRYVRPFFGVGVLGGFTTFSTYTLDARTLLAQGEPATAGLYLFGTLAAGLLAVWLGMGTARGLGRLRHRLAGHPDRDTHRLAHPSRKRSRR